MKRILLALLLLNFVKSITYWFSFDTSGAGTEGRIAMAGPNKEHVIRGRTNIFMVFTMDLANGQATTVDTINIGTHATISGHSRSGSDESFNNVAGSNAIFRFTTEQGVPNGLQFYSLPTGSKYYAPRWTPGTNFMLVGTKNYVAANEKRLYRVYSDRITGVETFTTGENSQSYGALYGKPWLVVSLDGTTERKVYDYTNGHQGGTDSALQTHIKGYSGNDIRLISPEDLSKDYYIVGRISTKIVHITKQDGTSWLFHDLASLDNQIVGGDWIKDTDLCIISASGTKYALVNVFDQNKPAPTYYTFNGAGSTVVAPYTWPYKRVILMPHSTTALSIYKAHTVIPCSDLCATCDEIYRNKCLTCVSGSTKSGDTCQCNSDYFESTVSLTKKECLACSPLCGTCSGVAVTDCGVCRYPYMEKKGDGSCGCPDGKYLSGISCLDCDSSCLTCSGGGPNACLSCDVSKGLYQDGSSCRSCDPSCKTCSGVGSSSCLSCDISKGQYEYGNTCKACDPSCKTCSGGSSSNCLSCSITEFLLSGSCSSCLTKDSAGCPQETKITLPIHLEELRQNITISFSPPLNASLPSSFTLTANELVQKHLNLTFKRKGQSEELLTILKSRLTHSKDSSQLFVEFLEKMRVSNTESIFLTIKEPLVYDPPSDGQNSLLPVYFKQNTKIKSIITEKKESNQERDERRAGQIAEYARIPILAVGAVSSVAICVFGSTTLFTYFVQFFNKIQILSNIAKTNVEFGSSFSIVMNFIEKLTIPRIDFIANLSPLKDSKSNEGERVDSDADAHKLYLRGARGKITETNEDVFIMAGQSFYISLAVILLWGFGSLFQLCFTRKCRLVTFCLFGYQMLIQLFFFKLQMICISEIALTDYTRMRELPVKYIFSVLISMVILILVLSDFSVAVDRIRKEVERSKMKKKHREGSSKKKEELSKAEQLALDRYTKGIDMTQKESNKPIQNYLLWIENLRYFAIQVTIASLQLLKKPQALIMLVINLSFFIFFLKMICSSKVFTSKLILVKKCF